MFLFFSVARSAQTGQAERANEAPSTNTITTDDADNESKLLVDVSPMALRMSSPFNSKYWLSAA